MRPGEGLLSKGSDEENFGALEATKAYFKHYPEIVIQRLGLQSCQATVVGDAMLRAYHSPPEAFPKERLVFHPDTERSRRSREPVFLT
ncbi:hypothetical protein PInf_019153 [Phytophthora infestans]|nr:hypothetical protein PInf_019153 [Phytophthora infestans]